MKLSRREAIVFNMMREGKFGRQIADELGISIKTVSTYCSRMVVKLECRDWIELRHRARTAPEPLPVPPEVRGSQGREVKPTPKNATILRIVKPTMHFLTHMRRGDAIVFPGLGQKEIGAIRSHIQLIRHKGLPYRYLTRTVVDGLLITRTV